MLCGLGLSLWLGSVLVDHVEIQLLTPGPRVTTKLGGLLAQSASPSSILVESEDSNLIRAKLLL
jgi:hypothetical protein